MKCRGTDSFGIATACRTVPCRSGPPLDPSPLAGSPCGLHQAEYLAAAEACFLKEDPFIRKYQRVRSGVGKPYRVRRGGIISFKLDFRLHHRCRFAAVMQEGAGASVSSHIILLGHCAQEVQHSEERYQVALARSIGSE